LPHLSALTRVARREETTHRRLCQARRTASFLELKRVRLRSHPESPEVVESPGTVRGEARFDFSAPELRAEIAAPLARDGIAAHVAVPSRKVLRGAIPARSGAPHGLPREPRPPPVT